MKPLPVLFIIIAIIFLFQLLCLNKQEEAVKLSTSDFASRIECDSNKSQSCVAIFNPSKKIKVRVNCVSNIIVEVVGNEVIVTEYDSAAIKGLLNTYNGDDINYNFATIFGKE